MKKSKQNIDNLFESARSQEPIISKDEARSLIEKSITAGPSHNILRNVKMNHIITGAAALAAAGALSMNGMLFDYFSENNPEKIDQAKTYSQTNAKEQPAAGSNLEKFNSSSNLTAANNLSSDASEEKIDEKQNIKPIADVKGVTITPINNNELEEKGIAVIKGKSIQFDDFMSTGGKNPIRIELSKSGVVVNFDDNVTKNNFKKGIAPKLITDMNGVSKYSLIKNTDEGDYLSFTDNTPGSYSKMQMLKDPKSNSQVIVANMQTNNDNSNQSTKMVVNSNMMNNIRLKMLPMDVSKEDLDQLFADMQEDMPFGAMNSKIYLDSLSSDINNMKRQSFSFDTHSIKELVAKSMKEAFSEQKIQDMLNNDSVSEKNKNEFMMFKRMQNMNQDEMMNFIDSLSKSQGNPMFDMKFQMDKLDSDNSSMFNMNIDIPQDSAFDQNSFSFNMNSFDFDEDSLNPNSELNFSMSMESNFENEGFDKNENMNNFNGIHSDTNMLSKLENKVKAFEDKIDTYIKINKLIPVSVAVGSDTENFILWFEPSEELIDKLPDELAGKIKPELAALASGKEICSQAPIAGEERMLDIWRSCSGSVENMSVYPNPTQGDIKVQFNLLEQRDITISINDYSGRKINDLMTRGSLGAGSYNMPLHLNNITPGMYLIVVQTQKGEQAVQRIVVE